MRRLLSPLLLLFLLLLIPDVNASPCSSPNTTTYLRSPDLRLMEFATHSLTQVTLNQCADACTTEANGHQCSSFEYDAVSQECAIHAEDGQPLGPSVLARADSPISFFQQICVREEHLCPTPYAFERYPQSMLVGYAMKVVTTDGLSECLSVCLSSQNTLSSPCLSLMYFYETGECILNRETKSDQPNLFRENVQETLVDYFENACVDVECSDDAVLHWLRSEDYSISSDKDVIVESMSSDECRALCASNSIGEERFPCRSFVYSASKQECHLSADSGYTGRRNSSFNLNPISSGEYFQKYCLNSTVRCLDASFEQVPNRKMNSPAYKTLPTPSIELCLSTCIEEGANCASVTYDYKMDLCHLSAQSQFSHPDSFSVSSDSDYFDKICDTAPLERTTSKGREPSTETARKEERTGETNTIDSDLAGDEVAATSDSSPVRAEAAKRLSIDTQGVGTGISTISESHDPFPLAAPVAETTIEQEGTTAEETVIDDEDSFTETSESPVKAHLSSECRMSGVSVAVDFGRNTTGSIYIKDHFATCRAEFTSANHIALHIPFPRSDEAAPRCPGIEMSPNHWSFMVVVQKNEMSSPSLVTSTDRIFNVTCDYTQLVEKAAGPGLNPHFDDSGGPELRSDRIKMSIQRAGRPVTVVPLGEHVDIVWTVTDPEAGLGFFINECLAERVGGAPPEPEPLKIIHRGCPEERVRNRLLDSPVEEIPSGFSTRLKVFRFDGSRRVRIKCTVDVCVERCPPVTCDGLTGRDRESYGRKKRQSVRELEGLLRRFKPDFSLGNGKATTTPATIEVGPRKKPVTRRSTVSGTLTVVDRQDSEGKKRENKKTKGKPRPEFSSMPLANVQVCLLRWQAGLAVAGAAAIGAALISILLLCFTRNRCYSMDDRSCASSLSGATCSSAGYTSSSSSSVYHAPSSFHPRTPQQQHCSF